MSGIIQRKSTPSGIASPSAGSVFMGVDTSGVFFTKDESGTVTVYPTEGGTFTGGTVSFLSATTLSSTTLNVDFTDTLNFKTLNNVLIEGLAPVELGGNLSGDTIGISSSLDSTNSFVGKLVGSLIFPDEGEGETVISIDSYLNYTTDGSNRALVLNGYLGNGLIVQKPIDILFGSGATLENYRLASFVSNDGENIDGTFGIYKESDSGVVSFELNSSTTGFEIYNDLSDNTASLFNIIDNNANSIFDVRNDGVFLPNIPTSDPVNAGQLWLDGTTLKVSAGV